MICIAFVQKLSLHYSIGFPDFPGCDAVGSSFYEALARGSESLRRHVDALQRANAAVPVPRTLYEIMDDPELVAWRRRSVLAQVDLSGRPRRRLAPGPG